MEPIVKMVALEEFDSASEVSEDIPHGEFRL